MSSNALVSEQAAATAAAVSAVAVPRLVVGRYSAWRPQMENALMRAGVAKRDYAEECADWAALASAVENWSREEELESINYALGRGSGAKGGNSASSVSDRTSEQHARRGAMEAVARTKKAFTLLYQALPDDLRRLVASVPQGYAYGLWSWLEQKYQSTDQDNVGDLWDQFTRLEQEEGEAFDAYKARVDQTFALLEHAKDKPSQGLYAHRLLWKLIPTYNPVVLALKASGKLKDATKIDWSEVVAFVNNHERSQSRLAGNEGEDGYSGSIAAAATTRYGRRGGPETKGRRWDGVECYKCGEIGHIASGCRSGTKDTRRRGSGGEPDSEEESNEAKTTRRGHGQTARSRFGIESDDEWGDDERRVGFTCSALVLGGEDKSEVQRDAATAVQERQDAVSTTTSAVKATSQSASSHKSASAMTRASSGGNRLPTLSGKQPERGVRSSGGAQRRGLAGDGQQQEEDHPGGRGGPNGAPVAKGGGNVRLQGRIAVGRESRVWTDYGYGPVGDIGIY